MPAIQLELEADLADVESVLSHASRTSTRQLLEGEASRLRARLEDLTRTEKVKRENAERRAAATASGSSPTLPTVKITNYGWDQSEKFVKIYITLNGIQNLPAGNVKSVFTDRAFAVTVQNFEGKNHHIEMIDLLYPISAENCQIKQKTDMLLIMLRKATDGKDWSEITKLAAAVKEKHAPKIDEKADPQESLMNMMKQMYDDGDDEMKRSIRKAWHEGQNKKTGGAGGMPDLDF